MVKCVVWLLQELDKSYSAQKRLLKQQEEVEMESVELQEFLQAEKAALADTLRDLETEVCTCNLVYTRSLLTPELQDLVCSPTPFMTFKTSCHKIEIYS